MINFNEKIKSIIEHSQLQDRARVFMLREDGIGLYDSIKDSSSSSISALSSGMFQASEALMKIIDPLSDRSIFRLSYDTSSEGIFILPIRLLDKTYFLGVIYKDCLNPGQLKHQVSQLKNKIEQTFKDSGSEDRLLKNRDDLNHETDLQTQKKTGSTKFLSKFLNPLEEDQFNQNELKRKNSSVFKNKPLLKSKTGLANLEPSREGFLFEEISDDEMDQLFFIGRS